MFNKFYQRISILIALCVCFEVYKLTPALLVYCGYLCFRSGTCGAWDVTIFRRLNAIFSALRVQNVVHSFSNVETSPETRKSQSFVDFDED